MKKETTTPASVRLSQRYSDALDRYIERKVRTVRKEIPGYTLSRSGALRIIVETALADFLETQESGAPEAQREIFDHETVVRMIEADLMGGNYSTQRELADRYGRDPAVVSRVKKDLEAAGKLLPGSKRDRGEK
jgi:hypothetical protein